MCWNVKKRFQKQTPNVLKGLNINPLGASLVSGRDEAKKGIVHEGISGL